MKRSFDITAAVVALLLLCVPWAVLTLLVRRKLGHPAFLRQTRPGLHGRPCEVSELHGRPVPSAPARALHPYCLFMPKISAF